MADASTDIAIIWRRTTRNLETFKKHIHFRRTGNNGSSFHFGIYCSRWQSYKTGKISKQLQLDIDKHNAQYPPVEVRTFAKAHDRFLIIDDAVYLVGASIKDLGKKWFGFTLMENTDAEELMGRI